MPNDVLSHLKRPSSRYPRKYVPKDSTLETWTSIEPLFKDLLNRDIDSKEALLLWIEQWSETDALIDEVASRLYINMTCDTASEEHSKAFADFVENVEPQLSPIHDNLRKKLLRDPYVKDLPESYDVWFTDIQAQLDLFRPENIELEKQISLEIQEYQKVTGSMTVSWKGETSTLQQVQAELENTDEATREKAWRTVWDRRLQDKASLNNHFQNLFDTRIKVAENCGYENFLDYIFKAKGRYDYTPQDCYDFHEAVEKCVVPRYRELLKDRASKLGKDKLRPWDLAVNPSGQSPLKPFKHIDELTAGVSQIFHSIDPEFGEKFDLMRDMKLLDLDSRVGKAPGGYQCGLEELRLPFIFMNAVGTNSDLFTLLHEGGHSLHQFFMEVQDLTAYRNIMAEIAEVASMSMELIGTEFLEHIYTDHHDAKRAKLDQFEDVIKILPWVATIDAFQHWMYTHPQHTAAERQVKWLELDERFGAGEILDWTGLETYKDCQWQRQLHLFEVPFYYIEYGIAQLGALGVYNNYKQNPQEAMEKYRQGLSLGGSQELPQLFKETGIPFDFSLKTVQPLMRLVDKEISKLKL